MMLPTNEYKIRVFVAKSGIDFRVLGEAMGETTKFVMLWWNQPDKLWLTDRQISNMSAFLAVSPERLLNGDIPIEEARQKFIQGPVVTQERYFKDAFSKVRTTAHIVRYLAIRFGRNTVDNLLREMGVHPCIYSSLDNKISIDFFVELLDHAKRIGLTHEEVCQLGCYMFLGVSGTQLGESFALAKNYVECYQVLDTNFHNFDRNFLYKVDLRDDGFEMIIRPGDVLAKKIHDGATDCSTLAHYRQYMMCWFPYLSGLPPLTGQLVKSLAYGDDHCVLRAKFNLHDGPEKELTPPLVRSV